MKISEETRYYLIFCLVAVLFWFVFIFLDIEFINIVFFNLAFVWHFSIQAPGVKEKVFNSNTRFSFLSVTVRLNHYLQLFIPVNKIPYGPSLVRTISPLLFTFLLLVAGGNGNLLFTLCGSFVFELIYVFLKRPISMPVNDPEIPPAIPTEENVRE